MAMALIECEYLIFNGGYVRFRFCLIPVTSNTVGAGAPRRDGNSSFYSVYSQIFSASFNGMGGESGGYEC